MPGFLYFLPKARQIDINQGGLSRWGLSYLVDDLGGDSSSNVHLHARGCVGIGGVEGMVVGSSANWQVEQVKLTPDAIEWVKFPKSFVADGNLVPSLGRMKSEPLPGPQDLARAEQIPGKYLTLVDGRKWLIPNARVITEFGSSICNLKSTFDLDDETGDWVRGQVLPQFRKIWDHGNNYMDARQDAMLAAQPGEEISWNIPNWQELVTDAIQANYRVSSRELATLGVLVSGLAGDIARILVDDDGLARIKKKEAGGTGPG